jgi:hypothetical protein
MRNPRLKPLHKRLTLAQQARRNYRLFMRAADRNTATITVTAPSWRDRLRSLFHG